MCRTGEPGYAEAVPPEPTTRAEFAARVVAVMRAAGFPGEAAHDEIPGTLTQAHRGGEVPGIAEFEDVRAALGRRWSRWRSTRAGCSGGRFRRSDSWAS